ncbi:electron transfer flavoprotein subunit beta/FixA family protein [Enterococcus massiliensis]|uniref:electron transfer flavoprotein subunit beta/FixA family protein n=1 Tax=Enterococcus massiliensis TaxID=1640685 RepID=UPI00065E526A|nr:electron transfer flavoprotein subunit beta/FixA family protein [Enterococcus massiliensis]
MKILVCVKQVPESNNVQIDPITHNLVRSGIAGIINPYDKNAIEAALHLKDQINAEVILMSMGPQDNEVSLREGMAMGADRGILLSSRKFAGSDTLATGYVLSQAIKKLGDVDLVFFGRQAVDADTGQVGPIVAEFLNWPQITFASELELAGDGSIVGTRQLENTEQVVRVQLPAIVTARSELNQPRYETPRNIQQSFKKEIDVWTEADLELEEARIGISGSPTIVKSITTPERKAKETVYLSEQPKEAVNELLTALKAKNLI